MQVSVPINQVRYSVLRVVLDTMATDTKWTLANVRLKNRPTIGVTRVISRDLEEKGLQKSHE